MSLIFFKKSPLKGAHFMKLKKKKKTKKFSWKLPLEMGFNTKRFLKHSQSLKFVGIYNTYCYNAA